MFEGQTWGRDGIDFRAVVSQNKNEPSFKNGWIPKSLSYTDIFLYCIPLKWLRIVLLPTTSRAVEESYIRPLTYGDLLRYLDVWFLMSACSVCKRGGVWSVTPFEQEENPLPYILG